MSPNKKTIFGFTLIELLTVIAIIGILAAILIPVVGRVRDSARAAQCVSNLRQTAQLFHTSLSENDGIFVSGQARDGTGNREDLQWGLVLRNSGVVDEGGIDVFFCPSQLAIRRNGGFPTGSLSTAVGLDDIWGWRTYGYNMFSDEITERSDATSGGNSLYYFNTNIVENPSMYPLFMDSVDDPNGSDARGERGLQNFSIADPRGGNSRGWVHLRHQDRANVVFLDGHVEAADQWKLRQSGLISGINGDMQVITFPRTR